MPVNSSSKGPNTNKYGPKKMCMGSEKGRQEKLGSKKGWKVSLKKPKFRPPKEKNKGKLVQGKKTKTEIDM